MGLSTTSRGSKPCALHCDALDSLMCHNSLCRRDGEIHAIPGRPNGRVFCKGSCDLGCSLVTRLRFSPQLDRKSTRLNSSHTVISYAVFCLKKKRGCTLSSTIARIATCSTECGRN